MNNSQFFVKLEKVPYSLVFLIFILCCYNFAVLYSASNCSFYPWCYKQMIFFAIFFPLMIVTATLDLRFIFSISYVIYFVVLFLLITVEIFGYKAMGAKRWVNLGLIRIQPAELAKIAVVLMLAKHFHSVRFSDLGKVANLIAPVVGILIPVILIIKQPDLGTGMVILFVSAVTLFAAGVRIWKFIVVILSSLLSAPIIWNFMHDYQKRRILTFLDPESDPLGASYNIIQSKIAIGSGGFWGKGFGLGTQTKLNFLPEHQTDFIFSTLAEELGFIGGFTLCLLYFIIIYLCLSIAVNARSSFSKLLVTGLISIFFFHIFINIAMVMGMLPVVGIPLPLMSYGGTMMGSILIGFGLIMNVHVNHNMNL
jgi:rod shape determining protein RodA